eukprot:gene6542-3187_t
MVEPPQTTCMNLHSAADAFGLHLPQRDSVTDARSACASDMDYALGKPVLSGKEFQLEGADQGTQGPQFLPGMDFQVQGAVQGIQGDCFGAGVKLGDECNSCGLKGVSLMEVAELRYIINDELLPRLRQQNVMMATGAVSRLYHLVVCEGPLGAVARQLVTEPTLIGQLMTLLGSCEHPQDPPLVTACLCVLDILSERDPTCQWMLLEAGWLDRVVPLLDDRDQLVRRFAERALCSIYKAGASGI